MSVRTPSDATTSMLSSDHSFAHPIYLDHNATAPLEPEALDAMQPFLSEHHGNSLSGHAFGRVAWEALEQARAQVAALIGAKPGEIIFNSGGSEGLNHAVKGVIFRQLAAGKKGLRLLYSATEHHAVEDSARWVERFGVRSEVLPVDGQGVLQPRTVARALSIESAALVAVMWANNEVGTLQPVAEIARVSRAAGALVLCDAVQAAGKVPVSVEGIDLMALAGHKLYGPKGVGALYVREGVELEPLIHGASHEGGRRAGTHAVALAVGMGAAAAVAMRSMAEQLVRQRGLRDRFEERLMAQLPGTVVYGRGVERLPNTTCASFPGVMAWELQTALDGGGIAISAGAACRSGLPKPSPVLVAMGVKEEEALGGVRFSLGRHTTEADVDNAVGKVVQAVRMLRGEK